MFGELLRTNGIRPEFGVTDDSGQPVVGVETHVFQNGGVHIIGLLSNPQLRVDELGPPEFKSNDRFAKPRTVHLHLPAEMFVYDLRHSKALGRQKDFTVALDPYEPAIFSVSATALPELKVLAPAQRNIGKTARIGISFSASTPSDVNLLHVEVRDPSGKVVPYYSGNLLAPHGRAGWPLPFAVSDPTGKWEIDVHDLLSGQSQIAYCNAAAGN